MAKDRIENISMEEKAKRKVTNEDVKKYEAMVEKYIRASVVKNWREASTNKALSSVSLGNSGYSIEDVRQQLRTEVSQMATAIAPFAVESDIKIIVMRRRARTIRRPWGRGRRQNRHGRRS